MTDLEPLNFSNQDLRNRSFRGKSLNRADFSGSDIRGCDFSHAQLVNANFERVRTGQTTRQLLLPILMAGLFVLVSANGIARLIFGTLGQTPDQPVWLYVVMLYIFLGVAGTGSACRILWGLESRVGKLGMTLSGICLGALTAFFYVGSYFDNDSRRAIAGAIVGAGLVAILSLIIRRTMAILILAMGAVAAYGVSFVIWTAAIAYLTIGRYVWGIGLGALSLVYVWFVVCYLRTGGYEIGQLIGTSFRGADITDAQFDQADLKNTDFSRVIGRPK